MTDFQDIVTGSFRAAIGFLDQKVWFGNNDEDMKEINAVVSPMSEEKIYGEGGTVTDKKITVFISTDDENGWSEPAIGNLVIYKDAYYQVSEILCNDGYSGVANLMCNFKKYKEKTKGDYRDKL